MSKHPTKRELARRGVREPDASPRTSTRNPGVPAIITRRGFGANRTMIVEGLDGDTIANSDHGC